jgi:ACS family D-galactonate transporter-like MFS transporter
MKHPTAAVGGQTRPTTIRWQMAGLAGLGVVITNIDRSTVSVALPYMSKDLHIAPIYQGLVLSWFFLAYAIFLLPVGSVVDKFGSRLVYGVGAIIWGIATLATAAVTGVAALLGLRLLLGVGEATQYPSCIRATTEWFPDRERTSATGLWDMGARIGGVLTLPIVTGVIGLAGWRAAFAVVGILALLWAIGWIAEYRGPGAHRRANQAERDYIRAGSASGTDESPDGPAVRWADLFRYRSTWGLMLGYFCFNYVAYFFITWFPSYLIKERGFDLLTLGILGTIPGIVAVLSELGSGFAQDRLITSGRSKNSVRKGFLVVGMLLSSSIAVAVVAPTAALALILLSFSYGALLIGGPALGTFPAEFAPTRRHIGALSGIQNSAGNVAGFLGPIITGALVTATGSFVPALVLTGVIAIAGAFNYLLIVPSIKSRAAKPAETAVAR